MCESRKFKQFQLSVSARYRLQSATCNYLRQLKTITVNFAKARIRCIRVVFYVPTVSKKNIKNVFVKYQVNYSQDVLFGVSSFG